MYTKYTSDLPLITFAKEMAINPAHFNGLDLTPCGIDGTKCINHWAQTSYDAGEHMSRDELSRVIYGAQLDIEKELKSYIAPKWTVETINWPKHYRDNTNTPNPVFKTKYGNLIEIGQPLQISTNIAVEYSDNDNDGFNEIATATYDLSLFDIDLEDIDVNKLYIYYPDTITKNWLIEPVVKSISEGVLTIEIDSWLLIKPEYINLSPFVKNRALSGCNDDIYLETVTLVYEYKDVDATEVEIFYKDNCNTDDCSYLSTTTCATIINAQLGTFMLDNINALCINLNNIEYIRVYTYSGYHTNYRLAQEYLESLIYLASARVPKLCVCDCMNGRISNLQTDMSNRVDNAKYTLTSALLHNPFGTKIGEVLAYRNILNYK
jgi:hypothetical protein